MIFYGFEKMIFKIGYWVLEDRLSGVFLFIWIFDGDVFIYDL